MMQKRDVGQQLQAAAHPRRVLHAHVLRAEDRAHQLLQHQADAPGGQQGFERAAVQEADHPALQDRAHQRRCAEAHRNGRHQVPAEQRGRQPGLKDALHDVGGVGADHHQLAVRHVDHAHQSVGDGQAQRGQKQHRAQADAAEDGVEAVAPDQRGVDILDGRMDGVLHRRVALLGQSLVQEQLGLGVAVAAQFLGRGQALDLVAAAQQARGAHQFELRLDLRMGLGGQRPVDQRHARFVGFLEQGLGGSQAHCVILARKLKRGLRCFQRAAHQVVVDDVLGVVGQRQLNAAGWIEGLVVLDDEDRFLGELHRTVLHGLDEGRRLVVGIGNGLVEGGYPFFCVAGGNGLGLVAGKRVGAQGRKKKQRGGKRVMKCS